MLPCFMQQGPSKQGKPSLSCCLEHLQNSRRGTALKAPDPSFMMLLSRGSKHPQFPKLALVHRENICAEQPRCRWGDAVPGWTHQSAGSSAVQHKLV